MSARYIVCASALHPYSICATVSCPFPHIHCTLRHAPCSFWCFLAPYVLVGKSCWYNSWIPPTVCFGAVFHYDIQTKQSLSRSSSFRRFTISFPCHPSYSISSFRMFCTAFLAHFPIFCFPTTSSSLV